MAPCFETYKMEVCQFEVKNQRDRQIPVDRPKTSQTPELWDT